MKLCLVAEDTYQDGAISCLFDVQIQSCQCGNERIRHFTAYADLIGKAPGAFGHDRAVADWPMVATALIAMTSMAINELITDMPPPR